MGKRQVVKRERARKDIQLRANGILASFDATALFPSIPLHKCIEVIRQLLLNDPTLSSRTSLTPDDINGLIQLCLSTSDFIYNGVHHTASDSGPIGLSLMVVVAEIGYEIGYEDRRTKGHRHPSQSQSVHGRHIRHPYTK